MGLLNHLFGNKGSRTAKKLLLEDDQRIKLWEAHLANYAQREALAKHFSFRNIDVAVANFSATQEVLIKIKALINPELVTLDIEEKKETQILVDLKRLRDVPQIEVLLKKVVHDRQKHLTLPLLFGEIHNLLLVELHLLRLVAKNPPNAKTLLLQLFGLIFHNEAMLYKPFREDSYFQEDRAIHAEIMGLARAVLLEEKLQEKVETLEEEFARKMVAHMYPESGHSYRTLAEEIYSILAEKAGAPVERGEDILQAMDRMKESMKDDALMHLVVKKLRPRYDEVKLKAVILAFRQAYAEGHFLELEAEFVT